VLASVFYKLREKPKSARRSYALLLSAGFTSTVALVWLVSGMMINEAQSNMTNDRPGIFSGLVDGVKNQWAAVVVSTAQFKEEVNNLELESSTANQFNLLLTEEDIELSRTRELGVGAETDRQADVVKEEVMIISTSDRYGADTSQE